MSTAARPDHVEAKVPLSRDRILRAAVELADEDGIENLSMRRLGESLGVEAMSLYHYVRNKQDLLGGMLDMVYSEIEEPAGRGDWRVAMRRTAVSFHEVLLRHRWACSLFMAPLDVGPARLRYMDNVLGRLRKAGFSAEMTHHAYHALDSHIVGFTLWLLPYLTVAQQQPDLAMTLLGELANGEMPHLAEHIEVHLAPAAPGALGEFEFGLNLILEGLDGLKTG